VLGTGSSVRRKEVISGQVKIVQALNGERWPIEAEYLEPVVHSLMHIDGYVVQRENCAHLALMVGEPMIRLAGTHIEAYIRRGEELGIHKGSTVAQRAAVGCWYDLTTETVRAETIWIKERQYRFAAPVNPQKFPVNCRLYTVRSSTAVETALIGGILNSSFVTLSTLLFGRPVGVEANWSTMVSDTEMMLVPDWNSGDQSTKQRVAKAFTAMCERNMLGYLSEHRSRRTTLLQKGRNDKLAELSDETELGQADRHELDDAVLQKRAQAMPKSAARPSNWPWRGLSEILAAGTRKRSAEAPYDPPPGPI